jgi:hypothetical protein
MAPELHLHSPLLLSPGTLISPWRSDAHHSERKESFYFFASSFKTQTFRPAIIKESSRKRERKRKRKRENRGTKTIKNKEWKESARKTFPITSTGSHYDHLLIHPLALARSFRQRWPRELRRSVR